MKIVKNDLFDYPNRYIFQYEEGFKFSLDSILLAEYVKLKKNQIVLDMCTGNAAIPLVLSTKYDNKIITFEIQKEIALLAEKSIKYNKMDETIELFNDDIKNIDKYYSKNYFDVITCNPPYFKIDENIPNSSRLLSNARHEILIDLETIFQISFNYLKNHGILYLVHRANRLDDIIWFARNYKINVKEVTFIVTNKKKIPHLVLVKCVKMSKSGMKMQKIIDVSKLDTYQHLFD